MKGAWLSKNDWSPKRGKIGGSVLLKRKRRGNHNKRDIEWGGVTPPQLLRIHRSGKRVRSSLGGVF